MKAKEVDDKLLSAVQDQLDHDATWIMNTLRQFHVDDDNSLLIRLKLVEKINNIYIKNVESRLSTKNIKRCEDIVSCITFEAKEKGE